MQLAIGKQFEVDGTPFLPAPKPGPDGRNQITGGLYVRLGRYSCWLEQCSYLAGDKWAERWQEEEDGSTHYRVRGWHLCVCCVG